MLARCKFCHVLEMKVYAHWQDDSSCMHQNWLTWVENNGHKNDSNIPKGGLHCRTESLPPNGSVWLSHHQNVSKGQQRFLHSCLWCIFWWDRCRRQSLPAISWEQKRRNLSACLATGNQDLHFFLARLRSSSLNVFFATGTNTIGSGDHNSIHFQAQVLKQLLSQTSSLRSSVCLVPTLCGWWSSTLPGADIASILLHIMNRWREEPFLN